MYPDIVRVTPSPCRRGLGRGFLKYIFRFTLTLTLSQGEMGLIYTATGALIAA